LTTSENVSGLVHTSDSQSSPPTQEVDLARLVQERDELKAHCARLGREAGEHCLHISQLTANLGVLSRLVRERDELKAHCTRLTSELGALAPLVQERDELKRHCTRLALEAGEHCLHVAQLTANQGFLARLTQERDELQAHCARLAGEVEEHSLRIAQLTANLSFPPGHFYSPVVDIHDDHVTQAVRDPRPVRDSGGIHIDQPGMEAFCERLARHHSQFPFTREPQLGFRYFYGNGAFDAHDAAVLFSMLLEYQPRRVIEVGSGYSSCLMLDTNERFFDGRLELTLIDPALEQIRSLIPLGDTHRAELIPAKVQDVPLAVFERLRENDILFLDSSHVVKTASDVNCYLFEILPSLAPGVLIHIHDMPHLFEYPEQWVRDLKRSWNEAYAVRAFLQYNREFPILYWTNFAAKVFPEKLLALMPMTRENGGASLWLQKRAP